VLKLKGFDSVHRPEHGGRSSSHRDTSSSRVLLQSRGGETGRRSRDHKLVLVSCTLVTLFTHVITFHCAHVALQGSNIVSGECFLLPPRVCICVCVCVCVCVFCASLYLLSCQHTRPYTPSPSISDSLSLSLSLALSLSLNLPHSVHFSLKSDGRGATNKHRTSHKATTKHGKLAAHSAQTRLAHCRVVIIPRIAHLLNHTGKALTTSQGSRATNPSNAFT
jgi:hypothetical protein